MEKIILAVTALSIIIILIGSIILIGCGERGKVIKERVYEIPGEGHHCAFLVVHNNKLYAGISRIEGKIYEFDGVSFEVFYNPKDKNGNNIERIGNLIEYEGKLYAGLASNSEIHVYDGKSWSLACDIELADERALIEGRGQVMLVYKGNLYFGVSGPSAKIYKYGGKFLSVFNTFEGVRNISDMVVYNDEFYVGIGTMPGEGSKLYKYNEQDKSWVEFYDFNETFVNCLAVDNGNFFVGVGHFEPKDAIKVYRYDGSDWDEYVLDDSEGNGGAVRLLKAVNNTIYAVGSDSKIYEYDDISNSWSEFYSFDRRISVDSIGKYNGKLYVGVDYPVDYPEEVKIKIYEFSLRE